MTTQTPAKLTAPDAIYIIKLASEVELTLAIAVPIAGVQSSARVESNSLLGLEQQVVSVFVSKAPLNCLKAVLLDAAIKSKIITGDSPAHKTLLAHYISMQTTNSLTADDAIQLVLLVLNLPELDMVASMLLSKASAMCLKGVLANAHVAAAVKSGSVPLRRICMKRMQLVAAVLGAGLWTPPEKVSLPTCPNFEGFINGNATILEFRGFSGIKEARNWATNYSKTTNLYSTNAISSGSGKSAKVTVTKITSFYQNKKIENERELATLRSLYGSGGSNLSTVNAIIPQSTSASASSANSANTAKTAATVTAATVRPVSTVLAAPSIQPHAAISASPPIVAHSRPSGQPATIMRIASVQV